MCRECFARGDRAPPSTLASAAAYIGLLSVVCGFVPGALAIVLAQIELSRIARGDAPASGEGWAQAGRAFGAVALALGAIVLLFVISR